MRALNKQKFTHAVLIGNAAAPPEEVFRESISRADFIVAADGGANHCFQLGVVPHLVIGDLDSISVQAKSEFQRSADFYAFPKDKDKTDLELAFLEIENRGGKSVEVFSWIDEAFEYSLSNILSQWKSSLYLEFITAHARHYLLNSSNRKITLDCGEGRKISVHPLAYPLTVKSRGLQWEIDWIKQQDPIFSQSNFCQKKASFVLKTGAALITCKAQ